VNEENHFVEEYILARTMHFPEELRGCVYLSMLGLYKLLKSQAGNILVENFWASESLEDIFK
jgi:hypothetical protein